MKYPYNAGYKQQNTSKEAAKLINNKAKSLRERIKDIFDNYPEGIYSAHDLSKILDASIYNIRPRLSELLALDFIQDTEIRKKHDGKYTICWKRKVNDND